MRDPRGWSGSRSSDAVGPGLEASRVRAGIKNGRGTRPPGSYSGSSIRSIRIIRLSPPFLISPGDFERLGSLHASPTQHLERASRNSSVRARSFHLLMSNRGPMSSKSSQDRRSFLRGLAGIGGAALATAYALPAWAEAIEGRVDGLFLPQA